MRYATIVGIFSVMLTLISGLVFAENVIDDSKEPSYLFVISGTSGSLDGDTLTLNGVPNVIYFSDRPDRVAGHIREFPSVAEAVDDARERLYDTVESKLYERIEAGDLTAIIFFLKTRCKHRGYSEKQIETPKEMIIKVEYADDIKRDESH